MTINEVGYYEIGDIWNVTFRYDDWGLWFSDYKKFHGGETNNGNA